MIVKKVLIFLLMYSLFIPIKAQMKVQGIIFDQTSRKPITQVEITNLNNKEQSFSNAKGEFSIHLKINELLVFKIAGYQIDTVLITNLKPLRRYMLLEKNMLNTINISGQKSVREEYAQVFNKANPILLKQGRGLLFYPSSYFSREGRQARRFTRMIKREEKEKIIDRRFNLKVISTLIPIQQPELDAFLVLYRPSVKFIQTVSTEDMKFYMLECYRKFKLLPPEQRILPSLRSN